MNLSSRDLTIASIPVAAGLLFLLWERRSIWLGLSSYWWSTTAGTIVKVQPVAFKAPGSSDYPPPLQYSETEFAYVYSVNGQTYRSTTYCFGGWVDRASADYSRRETVTVYYNPKHPEMSVLKRGLRFGSLFGLLPIGMGILYAILNSR